MSKLNFFIAHESTGGKDIAKHLKISLERNKGCKAFIAPDDVPPGNKNERVYRYNQIRESDYFIIIFTPNCLEKSTELRIEIEEAKKVKKENFIQIAKYKDIKLPEDLILIQRAIRSFQTVEELAREFDNILPNLLQQRGQFQAAEKIYEKIASKAEISSTTVIKQPISVIIPVRGEIEKLIYCLEGLSRQTYIPDEIIVVDDNSQNDLIELIKEYKANGLNIRYEKLPYDRLNISRRALARQIGMYLSRSDNLLFIDQDTLLAPKTIEKLLNQAPNEYVLVPQHFQVPKEVETKGKEELIKYISSSLQNRILLNNYSNNGSLGYISDPFDVPWNSVPFNCILIRKSWIEKIGGFDLRYEGYGWEDTDVKYRLFREGRKFREVILKDCASYHLPLVLTPIELNRRKIDLAKNQRYFLEKFPVFC
jgi:GT2 family glycosyltransferase